MLHEGKNNHVILLRQSLSCLSFDDEEAQSL
jgi:hypothetical protein